MGTELTITKGPDLDVVAFSGLRCTAANPAGRILSRLKAGQLQHFIGACTPFRCMLLESLSHKDIWLSSLEISSLLGEKDNETVGFDEFWFFMSRILKKCTSANLFVDCDSGWSQGSEYGSCFAAISDKVGMLSVQNIVSGRKENSLLEQNGNTIESPAILVSKLKSIRKHCSALLALRLENLICGQSAIETVDYVKEVLRLGGPVDFIVPHNKSTDVRQLIEVICGLRDAGFDDLPIAVITTTFASIVQSWDAIQSCGIKVFVHPNFALRTEFTAMLSTFEMVLKGEYSKIEKSCAPVQEVIRFVYERQ